MTSSFWKKHLENNIRGWDMRIIQAEEDIGVLQKRLTEITSIRDGLKEEYKELTKDQRDDKE